MATVINLRVKSDFSGAAEDLKKFGAVSDQVRKDLEGLEKIKADNILKISERTRRAGLAAKAAQGPLAGLKREYRDLGTQMQTLIRKGMDPQDKALKPLIKRYQQLEKEMADVNRQSKKNQKSFAAVKGAMTAIGVGGVASIGLATRAFIEFSRESAEAASDAEEIEGKFSVVFGSIAEDAKLAASTIAEDFDLAASTVNKLLGDTGDILTGLGFDQRTALELSESVGTLALDLASFTNFAGGAEGASAALTKALLGEAESAKALGIVIRQDTQEYKALVAGIMEAEGVGLIQAKALAALQIATEQSKNAIGDYARTIDSTANVNRRYIESQKQLKEAWGDSVNEGLTPLRKALAEVNLLMAENINLQREARSFSDDAADGVIDETRTLEELRAALAGLEQQRAGVGTGVVVAAQRILLIQDEIKEAENRAAQESMWQAMNARGAAITEQQRQAAADAAEEEAERVKWVTMRVERENELLKTLGNINTEEQLAIKLGQDFNAEQEKSKAVWEALNDLRKQGFDVESAGIGLLIERYGQYLTVKDTEIQKTQAQLDAEKLLQEEREANFVRGVEMSDATKIKLEEMGIAAMEAAEQVKAAWQDFAVGIPGQVSAVAGAVRSLIEANTNAELQALDAQAAARIAAGEDEVAVKEDVERQKAELSYKAALSTWKLQLVSSVASAAQAVINTLATAPWPVNLVMAPIVAGIGALQVAAVAKSKPVKSFQTGTNIEPFTVPGNPGTSRGDSQQVAVNAGEQVSVSARGEGGAGQRITVEIARQVIFDITNDGIESGDIRITADNVQAASA